MHTIITNKSYFFTMAKCSYGLYIIQDDGRHDSSNNAPSFMFYEVTNGKASFLLKDEVISKKWCIEPSYTSSIYHVQRQLWSMKRNVYGVLYGIR